MPVSMAIQEATSVPMRAPQTVTIDYDDGTISITGSLTYDDMDYYPISYVYSIVIDNLVPQAGNVTLIDGTLNSSGTLTETMITSSMDGTLTIVYKGTTYECVWDVN